MFCPECGKAMTTSAAKTAAPEALETVEPTAANAEPLATTEAETQPEPAVIVAAAGGPGSTDQVVHANDPGPHPGARRRTRETLHRASTAARGAIGDNVKRVEKIHHVSTAVFEEAHYDPSLRFVLVALGLFVVFVVLLIVSKVMG